VKAALRFRFGALLLAAALLCACAGCGAGAAGAAGADGRETVRISMYNDVCYPAWRACVEAQCPDVDIRWENNRNTIANVLYQAKHGDMPDLVGIRRFESDAARRLAPYLADLSGLEATAHYSAASLALYREGKAQRWLPEPGVISGMVANRTLFAQYGVGLPSDLDGLIAACRALEAHGVTVFASDCAAGWTCALMVEGFGAASFFAGAAGNAWRDRFASGETKRVDTEGFAAIADALRQLRENGLLTAEDCGSDAADVTDMLISGRAAVFRRDSDERYDVTNSYDYAALPFFGAAPEDSALFVYPVFSLAMARTAGRDDAHSRAVRQVLDAMLSAEAQRALNENGEGLVSFRDDVVLTHSASLQNIEPLIAQGRYFLRVLNGNTFAACKAALTALVCDGADNARFVSILNARMFAPRSDGEAARSDLAADNRPDAAMNAPAASVIAQVLRAQTGAACAVIDLREAAAPIYKGTYTEEDVAAVVAGSAVYAGELSDDGIARLLRTALLGATTFASGSTEPLLDYPALAGMKAVMARDGTVEALTDEGGAAFGSAPVRVAVSGGVYQALLALDPGLAAQFSPYGRSLEQCFADGFSAAAPLPEPQKYFVVQ